MRFLSIVKASENLLLPSPELQAAIAEMAEEMFRSGVMLDTAGLLPTTEATEIKLKGDTLRTIDGPFSEAKEVIGGYAILNVSSKEEAIALGRRFVEAHIGHLPPHVELTLEVRQMYDALDPDASSPAERAHNAAHTCDPAPADAASV